MADKGIIYLIPTTIAEDTQSVVLSPQIREVIASCQYFLVENLRTARRFISALQLGLSIEALHFQPLDKDTPDEEMPNLLQPALKGHDIGIMSEAGCPGIADPGSRAVARAHELGIRVVPLVGPSSIFLALMASGFSGQQFAFHGYLPIDRKERTQRLKELERESAQKSQTQIFMDTPYRNEQLLNDVLQSCSSGSKLCIGVDITGKQEKIVMQTLSAWKKQRDFSMHKIPAIFLLAAF